MGMKANFSGAESTPDIEVSKETVVVQVTTEFGLE